MKPGDIVRMSAACKRSLFLTGSHDHVREFGRCWGVITQRTDYGAQQGPEWDVVWHPSDLRYTYGEEHLVHVPLKAYVASVDDDYPEQYGAIVYAYTTQHARWLAAYEINADYDSMYAYRAPQHEARVALQDGPGCEHDPEYLRNQGWYSEGEWRCGSCGLAANGLEKYGVCRMCSQCKECGCEDDCDQTEGFSCE